MKREGGWTGLDLMQSSELSQFRHYLTVRGYIYASAISPLGKQPKTKRLVWTLRGQEESLSPETG